MFGTVHTRASRARKIPGVSCRKLFRVSSRVEVPASQVDRYLTRRLHKLTGFGAVSLSVGYRLRAPDEEGCNWSGAVVPMCGAHAPAANVIAAALPPFVKAARARFNLKE